MADDSPVVSLASPHTVSISFAQTPAAGLTCIFKSFTSIINLVKVNANSRPMGTRPESVQPKVDQASRLRVVLPPR